MVELAGNRVVSSTHACDQALRRVPLLRGCDRVASLYWVEQTAARALRDGRRARRCPRWCVRESTARGKTRQQGMTRYLWNEDLNAAFVATRVQDNQGRGLVWIVKTVITPG